MIECNDNNLTNNNILIDSLGLSIRTRNCLLKANIKTLGQLIEYDKNRLSEIRGMGKKSVNELNNLLLEIKLPQVDKMNLPKLESYKLNKDLITANNRLLELIELQKKIDKEILTLNIKIGEIVYSEADLIKYFYDKNKEQSATIISVLSKQQSEIFLYKMKNLSNIEIAKIVNKKPGVIGATLSLCYKKLRNLNIVHLNKELHDCGLCGKGCIFCNSIAESIEIIGKRDQTNG